MSPKLILPFAMQLALPLALIAFLAFGHHRDRLARFLSVVGVAVYVVAIALAGIWTALPRTLVAIYIIVAIPALAASRRTSAASRPDAWRGWIRIALLGAFTVLAGFIVVEALAGRRQPRAQAVDLGPPLSGGPFLVANGGSTELVNAHLMTLTGDRYRAYRGQSYGVDLVRLNRLGFRAKGIAPNDPARYVIFGERIVAPCAGTVVDAVDGVRDLPVPTVDRTHMAGNHVILACDGIWVVLAHMRAGSVRVAPGDDVELGDHLGRVGNSGNSDEPHLHIHAQLPAPPERPLSGTPVPIRIGGRYLVRNAVVAFPGLSAAD